MDIGKIVVCALSVVAILLFTFGAGRLYREISQWRRGRKVWCVCRVNNTIGLMLRSDYDWFSKVSWGWRQTLREWQKRDSSRLTLGDAQPLHPFPGTQHYSLVYIRMLVVLDISTPEGRRQAEAVVRGMYLEPRSFFVPAWRQPTPIDEAFLRIKGCKWDPKFLCS